MPDLKQNRNCIGNEGKMGRVIILGANWRNAINAQKKYHQSGLFLLRDWVFNEKDNMINIQYSTRGQ